MDAIADDARPGPGRRSARRNFIQPDEMPYDQGLMFQDGRPLIYDSGDYPGCSCEDQGPGRLGRVRRVPGRRPGPQGRRVGIGLACYVEGTGVGPYEGAHVQVETTGEVEVGDRADHAGPGPRDGVRPDRRRRARRAARAVHGDVTGDTRRFGYAVGTFASRAAVMSGNAVGAGGAQGAGEGAADRRRRPRGRPGGPGDRRRRRAGASAHPATVASPLATVAVLSNPLRYAFDEAASGATQFAVGRPARPAPGAPTATSRAWRPPTTTRRSASTFANGVHAAVVETDPETAEIRVLRYCVVHDCGTLINPMIVEGQVHGGVAQGIGGALYETDRLRRGRAAAQRLVHGLPDAVRLGGARRIETDHLETPSPLNPLGIKGAGEAGVIPGTRCSPRRSRTPRASGSTAMPISPSELCASCAGGTRPARSRRAVPPCGGTR